MSAGLVCEPLEAGLKMGGLIVEVVEVGVARWVAGRSIDCEGMGADGESEAGPSKGEGRAVELLKVSSGSSGAGVALEERDGVSSSLLV